MLAFIIYKCGTDWINVVLPPAAMGPVVALIGLELAGSAAETGCIIGSGVTRGTVITFLVTLAVAVFGSVLFRGFFSTIPILIAIICGYIAGVLTGVIKTQTIIDALHNSDFTNQISDISVQFENSGSSGNVQVNLYITYFELQK